MKPAQYFHRFLYLVTASCWLLAAPVSQADIFEDGPESTYKEPKSKRWEARSVDLPDWPGSTGSLVEINVSTAGLPYKVYVDPASITSGKDQVVRYTLVMISPLGVRNITYEGLHCGERNVRRIAYGSGEKWFVLKDSPWQPVVGQGIYQYRKLLYEHYFCEDPAEIQNAEFLARKLRYQNTGTDDE